MVMEEELSPHDGEELTSNIRVAIKQSPMSTNLGFVHMNNIRGLRWDNTLAGTMKRTRIFPYGFVDCNDIVDGEVGHSCFRGSKSHSIKICIIRKYTKDSVYNLLVEPLGLKPRNLNELRDYIQYRWED